MRQAATGRIFRESRAIGGSGGYGSGWLSCWRGWGPCGGGGGWEIGRQLDAEIRRIRAAGEPLDPEDFDPAPVPDGENAALTLQRAAAAMSLKTDKWGSRGIYSAGDWGTPQTRPSRRTVEGVLRANAEALALVRVARSKPRVDWGIRLRRPVFAAMIPELSDQRMLVFLLREAAEYHRAGNDDGEAVACIRDILAIADAVDVPPPVLTSHLVALSIDQTAANLLERLGPELAVVGREGERGGSAKVCTRKQVREVIDALLDEDLRHAENVYAYCVERTFALDVMDLVAEGTSSLVPILGGGVGADAALPS